MEEHAIYVEHEVKYTNAEPLPVRDVVASLLALERISRTFLPRTINALSDTEISAAELYVLGFEHGSLKEKVLVKLVFGSEERLDQFLDKMRAGKIGEALADAYVALPGGNRMKIGAIGIALTALLAAGVGYILKDAPAPPTTTNVFIIGGEAYGKSPEQFAEIVRAAVGSDRKKLAQDTARFIAPAKADPNGTIVLDNNQQLTIPAEVVQAVPHEYEPEPFESNVEYRNTEIEIRATDRDSSARGWAGRVPTLSDKRVKMELADGIDATSLSKRFRVRADIVVTSKPGKQGKMVPTNIFVKRIVSPDEDAASTVAAAH